jgi:hypothetical protein
MRPILLELLEQDIYTDAEEFFGRVEQVKEIVRDIRARLAQESLIERARAFMGPTTLRSTATGLRPAGPLTVRAMARTASRLGPGFKHGSGCPTVDLSDCRLCALPSRPRASRMRPRYPAGAVAEIFQSHRASNRPTRSKAAITMSPISALQLDSLINGWRIGICLPFIAMATAQPSERRRSVTVACSS